MRNKIAVIGSNMMDLVTYAQRPPEAGETFTADGFQMGCGGKGANQAVAAARLGADVMMVSHVGDDAFADTTIQNFTNEGIDARYVKRVEGTHSGVAPILVEPNGENRILIAPGANMSLTPDYVDAAADNLRACALILLQLEIPVETI